MSIAREVTGSAPRWVAASEAPAVPDEDTEVLTEEDEATEERLDEPWRVILYNDNIHTFDEVIRQVIKATGCTVDEAKRITFEAHQKGKAACYEGTFEECFRVQGVLREIQLVTEIEG
jgi:ATP-dependent Clp protease adapter protein ClpS